MKTFLFSMVGILFFGATSFAQLKNQSLPDTTKTQQLGTEIPYTTDHYILFPNAFHPNSTGAVDGTYTTAQNTSATNTIFHPSWKDVSYQNYLLQVYNRSGFLVFQTSDLDFGWNGYYRDQICPQDGYLWKVSGVFGDGQTFMGAGIVILLR